MTNPVNVDRELAHVLVEKCDSILELFYENARDAVGSADDESNIDTTELMNAVDAINDIRELRVALVEGAIETLFSQHRTALQLLLEMSLDMES